MSQENNNEKKKKISFEKKLIIFVIITIIIMIGITIGFIVNSKNKDDSKISQNLDNSINQEKVDDKKDKNIKRAKITDTYNVNPIKISEKDYIIQRGNISDEMRYIQIDGLKDENIEKSINEKIYNIVVDGYNNILEKGKKKYKEDRFKKMNIDGSVYTAFNGANILSGNINININKEDGSYLINNEYTFNISLVTGEDIKFRDIFTSDANMVSIAEQSIYENLAWTYQDSELGSDMRKIDYSSIEDKVFLYVKEFKDKIKNNKLKYYITSKDIYCVDFYSEKDAQIYLDIDMKKFVDYVAIYNAYSDKTDIYDGKYVAAKNLFIFEYNDIYCKYLETANDEDYFLRMGINSYFEDGDVNKAQADKLVEDYKDKSKNTINNYEKKVDKKSKAIATIANVQVMSGENNTFNVMEYYDLYFVEKNFYKKKFSNIIRDSCQSNPVEGPGIYIDYDENKYKKQVKHKYVYIDRKYNAKTLKVISEEISDSDEEDSAKNESTENNSNNTIKEENTINNNEVNTNTVGNVINNNVIINDTNMVPEAVDNRIENTQN